MEVYKQVILLLLINLKIYSKRLFFSLVHCMREAFLILGSCFLIHFTLFGQTSDLYINEFTADNTSGLHDEYYDFPDWIEIYNSSGSHIDLTGYSLTDDPLENAKWIFPAMALAPNQYLVVFASGKDLYNLPVIWSTLIEWGDEWKYAIPNASTPTDWYLTAFSDDGWDTGKSGFGYGDDDDSTVVALGTMSVYMRKSFTINDITSVERCLLHMDYDDAFIAYLNGVEIARANIGIPGTPAVYNAPAHNADHESKIYSGGHPDAFEILGMQDYLKEGANVLAIEIHNANAGSSDLTAIPFISFGYSMFIGTPQTNELLNLPKSSLHTNFKLAKGGEFLGFYDADGNVVDSLSFGVQNTNVSFGRASENTSEWGFFNDPSPGAINGPISFQFAKEPVFSISGGFFSGPQQIALSNDAPGSLTYYTLDGSFPNESSHFYTNPIVLDSTTAIRAISMEAGKIHSEVITQTYFIDEPIHLPFISIVTDPDHLFSDQSGIYVTGTNGKSGSCDPTIRNLNQDWERPINLEFYETNGTMSINQGAGIKIFGGCSRTRYPQKSFSLFARSDYGKGSFDYQFFPNKEIYEFESVILRSSADDQTRTMIKDAFAQNVQVEYMDIDYQAYRPAVVFINGTYWGIHNIREKINEHYLEENFGVDTDDVNILQSNAGVVIGSNNGYESMMDFVSSNSMEDMANFNSVKTQMDVNQFIDYQIANIYLAEVDWPGNNIKFWNTNSQIHHQWRWLTFDRDQTFLPYRIETNALNLATATNAPGWPNPPWSTLLFRRLLTNEAFKNTFIQLYAYHMNLTFNSERISELVDSFKATIEDEIPRHIERWGGQVDPEMNESWTAPPTFNSIAEWENNVHGIKHFARERPNFAITHLENHFHINGMSTVNVSVNDAAAGNVQLYHKTLPIDGYSGKHFNDIPLQLKAIPVFGYTFANWTITTSAGQETFNNPVIEITPKETISLTAHFEIMTPPDDPIVVINEINYNSHPDFNSGDWIELFNRSEDIVDISGWQLKDGSDEHVFVFPDDLQLNPNMFLVVCEDIDTFYTIFPYVNNRIGNLEFKFNNNGEVIRLYNRDGMLIDSVQYEDKSPWPETPDGLGPTLELIDPDLDNDVASNWEAALDIASPGRRNQTYTGLEELVNDAEDKNMLYDSYPNPASSNTIISYSIKQPGFVSLTIHDIMGRVVNTMVDQYQEPSEYRMNVEINDIPNGIYLYSLNVNYSLIESKRLIIAH